MDLPIRSVSLIKNPETILAAFERFTVKSDNLTVFGITALEIFVFFFGTFNCGIATHKTKSFGGSNLRTSNGFILEIIERFSTPKTD